MKNKGLSFENLPLLSKPREKLLRCGASKLSIVELLAVLIGVGTKGSNVLDCSHQVLSRCGSLAKLKDMKVSDLIKVRGLSLVKIARLKAALELGKRLLQENKSTKRIIDSAKDLVDFYIIETNNQRQSVFYLVLLNGQNEIILEKEIFRGTLTKSLIHPREIFGTALDERAAGIIVLYNHPSGDITPNSLDLESAQKLKNAGKILDIPLFDYIILGNKNYFSFQEKGML